MDQEAERKGENGQDQLLGFREQVLASAGVSMTCMFGEQ